MPSKEGCRQAGAAGPCLRSSDGQEGSLPRRGRGRLHPWIGLQGGGAVLGCWPMVGLSGGACARPCLRGRRPWWTCASSAQLADGLAGCGGFGHRSWARAVACVCARVQFGWALAELVGLGKPGGHHLCWVSRVKNSFGETIERLFNSVSVRERELNVYFTQEPAVVLVGLMLEARMPPLHDTTPLSAMCVWPFRCYLR